MKLGLAFLLLTCALLFSQTTVSPEEIIHCHQACDKQVATSLAACQKAAKNETQKKGCEAQAQAQATFCLKNCPSAPQKH